MYSGMITNSYQVQTAPDDPISTLDIWGPTAPEMQLTDTYTISPSLINEFRISY